MQLFIEEIKMKNAVIYIHGKGGNAEEAEYYKKFFSDEYDVIGFDYPIRCGGLKRMCMCGVL